MTIVTPEQKKQFDEQGYLVYRGLFSREETDAYNIHYMEMHEKNTPNPIDKITTESDPLKRYSRMLMMHRDDEVSLKFLIDARIRDVLSALLSNEPLAVQTMMYFKPPKARGQALHQDQYYLRVQPGTCVAAWMALDEIDDDNGCLKVVPGSHTWPLLCTTKADTTLSFTDVTVPIPEGTPVQPVHMAPGDVLFFNGQLIHGSGPNRSENRFRRSLIAHYVEGDAQEVATYYHPVLRMDGSEVKLDVSEGGGSCGIWVDKDGEPQIELVGVEALAGRTE